jgi:hypothetical protein
MTLRRALLASIALLAVGLWWFTRPSPDPREARVSPYGGGTFSTSLAPVETSLHDYERHEASSPRHYFTTGKSVTFSFPQAYYWFRANQAGGPQWWILLHLDRRDFSPTSFAHVARERAIFTDRAEAARLLEIIQRNEIVVKLEPGLYRAVGGENERTAWQRDLDRGKAVIAGTVCGMRFSYDPHHRPETYSLSPDLLSSHADLTAFLDGPWPQTGATGATCTNRSPICQIDFRYRAFAGDFSIPRGDFCQWRDMANRVIRFLDQHLVRETQPGGTTP